MADENAELDIVIIGAGCIGASCALRLIAEFPHKRITLVDRDSDESTASKDFNKIVRPTYPVQEYRELAEQASITLETKEPYRKYYHKSGWVQVISPNSYRSEKMCKDDSKISTDYLRQLVGSQQDPQLGPNETLWLNKDVAYVDSDFMLEAVAQEAAERGVRRERKTAVKLIIDNGVCQGAQLEDGSRVTAKTTIVTAGPWTPGLLKNSGVPFPENLFTTLAVLVAILRLTDEEFEPLRNMPILVTENGEVMFSEKRKALKMTTTDTFRADPEMLRDFKAYTIKSNKAVLKKMLPQFSEERLEPWLCPDLITPTQDPVIDKALRTENLFIGAAGSYHSFKFISEWGRLMDQRIRGAVDPDTLDGRLLERMNWNGPKDKTRVHPSIIPK